MAMQSWSVHVVCTNHKVQVTYHRLFKCRWIVALPTTVAREGVAREGGQHNAASLPTTVAREGVARAGCLKSALKLLCACVCSIFFLWSQPLKCSVLLLCALICILLISRGWFPGADNYCQYLHTYYDMCCIMFWWTKPLKHSLLLLCAQRYTSCY